MNIHVKQLRGEAFENLKRFHNFFLPFLTEYVIKQHHITSDTRS